MLPFPCSTCDRKFPVGSGCCIIPDTTSLSYIAKAPDGRSIGIEFVEKYVGSNKNMYVTLVDKPRFEEPTSETLLQPDTLITELGERSSGGFKMKISSIDYINTPDSAVGSLEVTGTISCEKASYNMRLKATWDFEEAPPTTTVEESKSDS